MQSLPGGDIGLTRWASSLEPEGSDSLGLTERLCGGVWRWLDQSAGAAIKGFNRVEKAVS